jgi:uncharacterized phage-associated protein
MNSRPFIFDAEKAIEVILYISKRAPVPDIIHVCKILYFADKYHLEEYGRFICGDAYIAMTNGPVPSGTYNLIKTVQNAIQSSHSDHAQSSFGVDGWNVFPLREFYEDLFSSSDMECLDKAIAEYGSLDVGTLIDRSHDDAYKAADFNSEIPIEAIAATLRDGDALLQHLREVEFEIA